MQRYLLSVGTIYFQTYWVVLAIAAIAAIGLAARASREWRLPAHVPFTPWEVVKVGSLTVASGFLGARLWFLLQYWYFFVLRPWMIPEGLWSGGLVWYGGLLGGLLAGWVYVRRRRISFLRCADQGAPFIALGHGIGRMGCFLHGCCYGMATTAWCGVVFPVDPAAVVRLPVQLFEAAALFVLYGLLRTLQRSRLFNHPGKLSGIYLTCYAPTRFLLEFLRGDQTQHWMGLTIPQVMSLAVAVAGFLLLLRRHRVSAHSTVSAPL